MYLAAEAAAEAFTEVAVAVPTLTPVVQMRVVAVVVLLGVTRFKPAVSRTPVATDQVPGWQFLHMPCRHRSQLLRLATL
jgi:hypothetical protein